MSGRHILFAACLLGLGVLPGPQVFAAEPAATVEIRDYKFNPSTVTVKVGSVVRWFNAETRTSHSVQFRGAGFQSERLMPDESWEHRFDAPGNYPYECDPHTEMKGEIVVTE